jgi:hypothetical protein
VHNRKITTRTFNQTSQTRHDRKLMKYNRKETPTQSSTTSLYSVHQILKLTPLKVIPSMAGPGIDLSLSSSYISRSPTVRFLTPRFEILIILLPARMCLLRDSNPSCDEVITHRKCENARKLFLLDECRPT